VSLVIEDIMMLSLRHIFVSTRS